MKDAPAGHPFYRALLDLYGRPAQPCLVWKARDIIRTAPMHEFQSELLSKLPAANEPMA